MTLNYAGRSHDEAVAARHKQKQKAQEQAGGEMAIEGTEADAEHSRGELSERGTQVWRSGSGINGGGGSDVALSIGAMRAAQCICATSLMNRRIVPNATTRRF
jgi:hypothetical protein